MANLSDADRELLSAIHALSAQATPAPGYARSGASVPEGRKKVSGNGKEISNGRGRDGFWLASLRAKGFLAGTESTDETYPPCRHRAIRQRRGG